MCVERERVMISKQQPRLTAFWRCPRDMQHLRRHGQCFSASDFPPSITGLWMLPGSPETRVERVLVMPPPRPGSSSSRGPTQKLAGRESRDHYILTVVP